MLNSKNFIVCRLEEEHEKLLPDFASGFLPVIGDSPNASIGINVPVYRLDQ